MFPSLKEAKDAKQTDPSKWKYDYEVIEKPNESLHMMNPNFKKKKKHNLFSEIITVDHIMP